MKNNVIASIIWKKEGRKTKEKEMRNKEKRRKKKRENPWSPSQIKPTYIQFIFSLLLGLA